MSTKYTYSTSFHDQIKDILEDRKMSQSELAEKLGIAAPNLSKRLTGKARLEYHDVQTMLEHLDVPEDAQIKLYELAGYPLPFWVTTEDETAVPSDEEEYLLLRDTIEEQFRIWQEHSSEARAQVIIEYEAFTQQVNTHIKRLNEDDLTEDQRAYLVRCAVQHGKSGKWHEWLLHNRHNTKIVPPLVYALTSKKGWKPAMRSARILEILFGKGLRRVIEKVDYPLQKRSDIREILRVIESGPGMIMYLIEIEQSLDHQRKQHAAFILEEFFVFKDTIDQFSNSQSISKHWYESQLTNDTK